MVERVVATKKALELIALLKSQFGDALIFHQSGGCCDNSTPNCILEGELTIGAQDVHLGDIGEIPFYMSRSQYASWQHTQLIIDILDGNGGNSFSLESTMDKAFYTTSRVFTAEEMQNLPQIG